MDYEVARIHARNYQARPSARPTDLPFFWILRMSLVSRASTPWEDILNIRIRCHVLAHESFEDESTAQIMNDNFVNVKIDREERPDVDRMYMTYLQAGRFFHSRAVFR